MTLQSTFQKPSQVITFIPQPQKNYLNEESKVLILDSGTLINLSMNGLLDIIPKLKQVSNVRFIITKQVKYETVDRPVGVPRFELGALRVQELLQSRDIEMPNDFNVPETKIISATKEFMDIANHSIESKGKFITIVSDAEMSCLALSKELTARGIENMVSVDERTTRLLAEKPENLQKIMSEKLHLRVSLNLNKFDVFKEFRFIRSTELVYVAFKKNVLDLKTPKALEAVLYATKFKGSSVSFEEIEVLKKL